MRLTLYGLVCVEYAAHSKTTVNAARPMSYLSKTAHSTVKRPIHKNITFKNSNINQRVNTVKGKKVTTARPKAVVNVVKGNNVNTARSKAVVNAVKVNHVNAVKASACWVWKPKIKIIYHVSKHNSASITLKKFDYIDAQGRSKSDQGVIDSGCSRHMTWNMSYLTNYKEIDEGYVAFRGNPKGGKNTGKCTIKTGKKRNLVRGLPSKLFENDQTCVACQKGKQHRASLDHKVKVIRCDNGTEFKNREMNQFCEIKGILRQYSVARTPQQNRVAKRRNRTLIEAARTMLADSKLPTTFWAEAVNIACYVQNKVLVVKPHNKTPYELFHGRTPTLSFMRPFGCLVTILNTIDHLGKFDGKADEDDGFKPSSNDGKKVYEDLRKDSKCNDLEKEDNVNSTNTINAAATLVSTASTIPVSAATITDVEITLAQALAELKSARPKATTITTTPTLTTTTAATTITAISTRPKAKGIVIHE
ncbi:ribonuclease H-like domain-containing protein [Tanacetum coccineum]